MIPKNKINIPEGALPATAVAYARVSSKDQEREGYSVPAQLALLREYAAANGIVVAQEFVDVETAKQVGRTGFGQMIAFFRTNHKRSCILLVEKTDRLYRNLKDWVTVDGLEVEIHLVKENVVLSPESRSSEKFMHGIKVLMAKNYIDNLSEETRKGMLQKARQGMWPSYAPLGYTNVMGADGKRTIVPDPEIAPIVRHLFEMFASGNHSLKSISKLGGIAGLTFRKSAACVPTSTTHKILRNRIYTGDFDFDGVTYKGTYQPIVPRELWEAVQEILDGRGTKKTHRVKDTFAFSGLMTCGHCGCALVGEIKKGRYVYYHCTGYKGKCPERYTQEKVFEQHFTKILKDISFSSDVLAWVKETLRESHHDEKRHHDEQIEKLQREGRRIQDRIDDMYLDKLDGRIDAAFFDRKATDWRADQDRLSREIESHRNASRSYIEEGVKLLELAQRAHILFERQSAREKRKLLDFVLSNCSWKNGELMPQFRQPFDLFAGKPTVDFGMIASGSQKQAGNENWLPETYTDPNSALENCPGLDSPGC